LFYNSERRLAGEAVTVPYHHRNVLAARFVLAVLVGLTATRGEAGEQTVRGEAGEQTVRIQWRVPRAQVVDLREDLQLDGTITPDRTTIDESRGLPLIYVFAGLAALPSLVTAIRTAVRDVVCGGVVVEDTGEELAIRCEPSLGVGTIIIRSIDGTRVERFEEVQDPSSLLDALTRLRGGL
jgi:hypothetical protein